jgi:hypothetical protein
MTVADATMDVAVCREVLSNLLEALRVLEETDAQEERYRQLLAALPRYEINAEGGLREWVHPDLADVQTHRHMSHLYGLFLDRRLIPKTHRKLMPRLCALWNCARMSWAAWPDGVSPSWRTSGRAAGRVTGRWRTGTVAAQLHHAKPADLAQRLARPGAVDVLGPRSAAAFSNRSRNGLRFSGL